MTVGALIIQDQLKVNRSIKLKQITEAGRIPVKVNKLKS